MNYNSDKPIEYSEQDLLGRTTFSKQLGKQYTNMMEKMD